VTYRQIAASCPSCTAPLLEDEPGRLTCRSCGGVLIADSVLGELLRAAAPDAEFPHGVIAFPRRYDAVRIRCPVCRNQMKPGVLFGVPVDQCYVDGVWTVRDGIARIVETVHERSRERAGDPG
jgi:Zn-finger nucleic acid-binding protein